MGHMDGNFDRLVPPPGASDEQRGKTFEDLLKPADAEDASDEQCAGGAGATPTSVGRAEDASDEQCAGDAGATTTSVGRAEDASDEQCAGDAVATSTSAAPPAANSTSVGRVYGNKGNRLSTLGCKPQAFAVYEAAARTARQQPQPCARKPNAHPGQMSSASNAYQQPTKPLVQASTAHPASISIAYPAPRMSMVHPVPMEQTAMEPVAAQPMEPVAAQPSLPAWLLNGACQLGSQLVPAVLAR